MEYAELLEQDFQRQIRFNHIKDYHDMGYTGKGYTILNAEDNSDHMLMTNKVIKAYLPDVEIINGVISGRVSNDELIDYGIVIDGVKITLEEAIEKYNIKVITRSYSGSVLKPVRDYFKKLQKEYGVIFFCSAGNDPGDVGCWARDNTAITVAAVKLKEDGEIVLSRAESPGEVDFSSFMARGNGTSAASPGLASLTIALLERYGDFNQEECVEILKSISKSLGNSIKFGYGLPILPLTDKLIINIGGQSMDFTDVKETDWFYKAVKYCVDNGYMKGDGDTTFEPNKTVTRAELAQVIYNMFSEQAH